MCAHNKPPTYYHVMDDNTGEHISTYTDRHAAYARSTHEALTNGRDWAYVTTDPLVTPDDLPTVLVDGRYYKDAQLISVTNL